MYRALVSQTRRLGTNSSTFFRFRHQKTTQYIFGCSTTAPRSWFATSSADSSAPRPPKVPSWKQKQLEAGMDDSMDIPMDDESYAARLRNEAKQGPQGIDLIEWVGILNEHIQAFKQDPVPYLHPQISWDELGVTMQLARYSEHPVAKYAIHLLGMLSISAANRKSIIQSALPTIVNVFVKSPDETRMAAGVCLGQLATHKDAHSALIALNVHNLALRLVAGKNVPGPIKHIGWSIIKTLTQHDVKMKKPEDLVPFLLESLASADEVVRSGALTTLANLAHDEYVQYHVALHLGARLLVPMLDSTDKDIAATATRALAVLTFSDASAVEVVLTPGGLEAVKKRLELATEPVAQEQALLLVAHIACFVESTHEELRKGGTLHRVAKLLQSSSDAVRYAALWALANYFEATDTNLAPQLVPLLLNPNPTGQSVPAALAAISAALYNNLDNARAFHKAKGTPVLIKFLQKLDFSPLEIQAYSGIALGSILSCEDLYAEVGEEMKALTYLTRLLANCNADLQLKLLQGLSVAVRNWKIAVDILSSPHLDVLMTIATGKDRLGKVDESDVVHAAQSVLVSAREVTAKRSSGMPLEEKLKFIRVNLDDSKANT